MVLISESSRANGCEQFLKRARLDFLTLVIEDIPTWMRIGKLNHLTLPPLSPNK